MLEPTPVVGRVAPANYSAGAFARSVRRASTPQLPIVLQDSLTACQAEGSLKNKFTFLGVETHFQHPFLMDRCLFIYKYFLPRP